MKAEDMGFNVRTWHHDRRLTRAESCFLGVLWVDHVGRDHKISAIDLARAFAYGMEAKVLDPKEPGNRPELEQWKRDVRYMQTHLIERHDHIPLFSKAGTDGGYWIAADDSEADEYYYPMRQRGIRGIRKATRGKKASMIEAVTQLAFDFDFDEIEGEEALRAIPDRPKSTAPEIVDALLDTMTRNPERFSERLERLREKYFSGGVVLGRDRLAEVRGKAKELERMVAALG